MAQSVVTLSTGTKNTEGGSKPEIDCASITLEYNKLALEKAKLISEQAKIKKKLKHVSDQMSMIQNMKKLANHKIIEITSKTGAALTEYNVQKAHVWNPVEGGDHSIILNFAQKEMTVYDWSGWEVKPLIWSDEWIGWNIQLMR